VHFPEEGGGFELTRAPFLLQAVGDWAHLLLVPRDGRPLGA
jgi:hypothetical protein